MEDIKISSNTGDMQLYYHSSIPMSKVGVIQSLADNDPDVDALYRLVQPVAFKVAKMREAIMEDQDEFLMRNSDQTEAGLERATRLFGGRSAKMQICILPICVFV